MKTVMADIVRSAAFLVPVLAALLPDHASAVWLDCQLDYGMSSRASDQGTVIEVFNDTRRDLHLYWMNFDGAPEHYATIQSGDVYSQQTYQYHVWMVTYLSGDCRNMFRVDVPDEFFRLHE